MKAKWGALVVDGRGKIGGHVASKNAAGAYFRTKVTPSNPQTSYQQNQRAAFTGLSQSWRALTPAQRNAWNSAVGDFKKTDVFGDIKTPSGFNLYMRLNGNLVNIGQTKITVPPLPSAVFAFSALSLTAAEGAAEIVAVFADAIPAGTSIIVSATPAVSAGKNFVKSEFRQIKISTNTETSPADVAIEWIAKFGTMAPAGSKIFIKLLPVNDLTGQQGGELVASTIVAA